MVVCLPLSRVRYILEQQNLKNKGSFCSNLLSRPIPLKSKLFKVKIQRFAEQDNHPQPGIITKELGGLNSHSTENQNSTNKNKSKFSTKDKQKGKEEGNQNENAHTAWYATAAGVGGIALLIGGGYLLQDQIKQFLDFFIHAVEKWGVWGSIAYGVVYAGLEVLAVPAIPLTMTSGVIFGIVPGTIIVSIAGTFAATISFLIARYVARERVLKIVGQNPKLAAIDKAIGKDGFKVVVLLRLSPLLPLAASNYFYGLTSVDLVKYVVGSWLGMLPGTIAYVFAGSASRDVFLEGQSGTGLAWWQIALGVGTTILALLYVGRIAKNALEKYEQEDSEDELESQPNQQKQAHL
eukprot:TRINITY_DN8227_c0_g4_i1.p1 TRINITY_DN8227_c0_g4~~TRINITY_DN8227_c0_g4_i1.p1  ORF type:complete len:350 (+),score=51.02 TRINITY_DN8227_c0_g4_i1:104-1153(+)